MQQTAGIVNIRVLYMAGKISPKRDHSLYLRRVLEYAAAATTTTVELTALILDIANRAQEDGDRSRADALRECVARINAVRPKPADPWDGAPGHSALDGWLRSQGVSL